MEFEYRDNWAKTGQQPLVPYAPVDEAMLFGCIARAGTPNVPGLALGSWYARWPYLRYGPLVVRSPARSAVPLRLLAAVRQMDQRKLTILAEDFGVGFAAHHLGRIDVAEFVTKQELATVKRRLALLAGRWGVQPSIVRKVSRALGVALGGSDFVGYSPTIGAGTWILWEAKGLYSIAQTPERAMAKGKSQNAVASKALVGVVTPISLVSVTQVGFKGTTRPLTIVDTGDPPPETSLEEDAHGRVTNLLRDAVAEVHYEWVASFLGVPPFWKAQSVDHVVSRVGEVPTVFTSVMDIGDPEGDGPRRLTLGLRQDRLGALVRGDLDAMSEWPLPGPDGWLGGLVGELT
jgi:hypothetical protein